MLGQRHGELQRGKRCRTRVLKAEHKFFQKQVRLSTEYHQLTSVILSLTKRQRKSSGKEHLLRDKDRDASKGDITGVL